MILLDLSGTDPASLLDEGIKEEEYRCASCFRKLTHPSYLIAITGGIPSHTFTNPLGFVYNLLTFSFCKGYREISAPCLLDTWFPGYSWSVINCLCCGNILGWKYVKHGAEPPSFFGLIRERIQLL